MKFEVINDRGNTVFYTYNKKDIPKEHLQSMVSSGHKFKIDGKVASKKKVEELLSKRSK